MGARAADESAFSRAPRAASAASFTVEISVRSGLGCA
jgi:hypothetical protein